MVILFIKKMLIEQINETNFFEKNEEGRKRVELKIRRFENQIAKASEDESKRGRFTNPSNKDSVDWFQLYDPTIWAYKVLKDKQNKPLLLRGYQDNIINDKHQFIVVAAANQIGKTWTACIKAIHHAIHVNNASVLIISRSEQQAIMILDEIKWFMLRANIKFDTVIGEVENRTELQLKNEDEKGISVIRCLPPTTSVLAYPATLIILDELGVWETERIDQITFFEQVIVSRIQETQEWDKNCICGNTKCGHFTMGQIFVISNPNGQQGALWYLWNNQDWHQYRYCWLAKQGRTIEHYNKFKPPRKPSDIFDSVYAAVFSSASGGFITQAEWNDAVREYNPYPPLTIPLYLGGDFAGEDIKGRDTDDNVLFGVIGTKEGDKNMFQVTYYQLFPPKTKKEDIYNEISKFSNIAKFAYDKVGVGDSVKNDLIERGILSDYQIESLTYSLPNKSEVYINLKHLFEQRKIIVPNLPKLKEQLLGLRFERTEGWHIKKKGEEGIPLYKIHHATEGLKDDHPDALANACYAARVLKGMPVELTIIPYQQIKQAEGIKKGTLMICKECGEYFKSAGQDKCERHSELLFI